MAIGGDTDVQAGERAGEVGHLIAAVFSATSDAVVVVDDEGSIVLASPAVADVFGYFPVELVGESVELLVPHASRDVHATMRRAFTDQGEARQLGPVLQINGLRRDGREVPIDVSLSPVDVGGRRYVAAFVRDATERVRHVRELEAVVEVTRHLLAGASLEETLGLTIERARELVDAASAWLVTPDQRGRRAITLATGLGETQLVGLEVTENTRSARVLETGELEVVADMAPATDLVVPAAELGLGPGIFAPLGGDHRPIGVLVLARRHGDPPFGAPELGITRLFSAATAVALTLGGARQELERLRLVEEDERIARNLHDTIVQRAFAIGMSLEAVRHLAGGTVLERIDAAVHGLDEMIRDLRNAIFRLSYPLETGSPMARISELTEELAAQLGFTPRLAFRGAVDRDVDAELTGELLVVCREALANVARHAAADEVDVAVLVEEGHVALVVSDNGIGVSRAPKAGSGLANMRARAHRLGGAFDIAPGDPRGTVVTWRVPLRRPLG